ncbi:MAG: hypothetical protein IJB52_06575 [Clostridia bacterium]|nr:hypothetical protein [Clostridia bacterium]
MTESEKKASVGERRTKIIVKRSFGECNVMELYSDYVAEKILTDKRIAERGIA